MTAGSQCREVSMPTSTIDFDNQRGGASAGQSETAPAQFRALSDAARLDSKLLHTRDERRSLDAHARGRPLRTGNSTVGLLENARDLIAIMDLSCAENGRCVSVSADLSQGQLQGGAMLMCQDHRALDEIFQFADISRPMPSRELLHRGCGNGVDLFFHAAAVLLGKVTNE